MNELRLIKEATVCDGVEGYLERDPGGYIWIKMGSFKEIWNLDTIRNLNPALSAQAARMLPGDKIAVRLKVEFA
jgi:hypothetical protein